ncbi:hypothetical protein DPMN_032834 [Dreissena polymorpha]|uniref:Uncharacterized protein n=1 Tax=Dreissena polymorpha TaxID=45954 RepID=A0A9D4M5H5_DREPO|nr:hypothetical protein DPMN_032834 [Dreissena polymorpha]
MISSMTWIADEVAPFSLGEWSETGRFFSDQIFLNSAAIAAFVSYIPRLISSEGTFSTLGDCPAFIMRSAYFTYACGMNILSASASGLGWF